MDGVATPTIDLGEVTALSSVRMHIVDEASWGICAPEYAIAQVSNDGETFTDVATVTEFEPGVTWVEFDLSGQSAQYVRLAIKLSSTWFFMDEIEIYGAEAGSDEPEAPEAPAEAETFWLTHYNDGYVEGSGVIFTEEDTAGGWWIHVAFAPVEGTDAYEIVEITNGLSDGLAAKVAVPAGGFVWAANYGNNYPALGYGEDSVDYTSINCSDAILRATAWKVGDQFVISGVDFTNIPTSTPDVKWYDDAYVCTATIAPYVPTKTWENTLTIGENGNAAVEVPYGYTWEVNYVDGKIGGEDVTICTTDDAYKACNPNWAITVLLNKQEDGTYVAAADAVVTPGNADKVTVGENQIALVVHSSSSNPDAGYANWEGKVVALSVKAGDVFVINEEMTSVYAVIPGEDLTPDEPETPDEPDAPVTGDAGVLVFAVLAVVAVVGCAVATKIKASAL